MLALTDIYARSRMWLYSLVETVLTISLNMSVIHLITYQQATYLHPARDRWFDKLMERLYQQEERQTIRLIILNILRDSRL